MADRSLKERVDEVVSMWENDEYDNFKDVIMDCHNLLGEIPAEDAESRARIEAVLAKATSQAEELADENPGIEEYLSGLILPKELRDERKPKAKAKPKGKAKVKAKAKTKAKAKPKPKAASKPKAKAKAAKAKKPRAKAKAKARKK